MAEVDVDPDVNWMRLPVKLDCVAAAVTGTPVLYTDREPDVWT